MKPFPVIAAVGGVNAGGMSSSLGAYKRTVLAHLPAAARDATVLELASLMHLAAFDQGGWTLTGAEERLSARACAEAVRHRVCAGTLIRDIDPALFDPQAVPVHVPVTVEDEREWALSALDVRYGGKRGRYRVFKECEEWTARSPRGYQARARLQGERVLRTCHTPLGVSFAASLPAGLNPGSCYKGLSHPRALSMALFAISDALGSLGLDPADLVQKLRPDQMAVYAANSIGQFDHNGWGGMLRARLLGAHVHAKQMPLGYPQMCADFINA